MSAAKEPKRFELARRPDDSESGVTYTLFSWGNPTSGRVRRGEPGEYILTIDGKDYYDIDLSADALKELVCLLNELNGGKK